MICKGQESRAEEDVILQALAGTGTLQYPVPVGMGTFEPDAV
jgi:hypothetical protein